MAVAARLGHHIVPLTLFAPALARPSINVAFHPIAASAISAIDRRWPAVAARLCLLQSRGRRSVRIVDVACGAGELLLRSARLARRLGFLAIELRGVDRDPRLVARARIAASLTAHPSLGACFEVGDPRAALLLETEFPADIILYPHIANRPLAKLAQRAGDAALAPIATIVA